MCCTASSLSHRRRRSARAARAQRFGPLDACKGDHGTRPVGRRRVLLRGVAVRGTAAFRHRATGRWLRARTTRRLPDAQRARKSACLARGRAHARFTIDDAYRLFPGAARTGSGEGRRCSRAANSRCWRSRRTLVRRPATGDHRRTGRRARTASRAQVAACLQTLQERGVAMLLIEQRMTIARGLATRVAVMGHGAIVFDGTPRRARRQRARDQRMAPVGG